jgi:Cu-processing system ATP-binding protein
MPTAIEFCDVTKRYGTATVVNGLRASIGQGEVTGLLGHNGAGKTTLIKLVLGLIRPTAGSISVFGRPAGSREVRARIGYLPENVAFYGNLTGREVLEYFARLKNAPHEDCTTLLERVGLEAAAGRAVRTYSKGMRQRLGLAQALLGSPELLVMDEPTTGLDPMASQQFFGLIGELKAQGRTVVISSHLLGELEPHIDNALILREGRLVAQGTLADMHHAAALPDTIAARFSGSFNGLLSESWITALAPRLREPLLVELDVPPGRKMEVVRRLMAIKALADITVKEPTLSRLYAAVGGRETSGERIDGE